MPIGGLSFPGGRVFSLADFSRPRSAVELVAKIGGCPPPSVIPDEGSQPKFREFDQSVTKVGGENRPRTVSGFRWDSGRALSPTSQRQASLTAADLGSLGNRFSLSESICRAAWTRPGGRSPGSFPLVGFNESSKGMPRFLAQRRVMTSRYGATCRARRARSLGDSRSEPFREVGSDSKGWGFMVFSKFEFSR